MDLIGSSQDIQSKLLAWFSDNGRHWIPWKLKEDGSSPKAGERISPYEIWIAEIMLQQTQLNVVIPYWKKWIKTFPDLSFLVEAKEHNILMQWQGLGYYSRAKRIHLSSKLLVDLLGKSSSKDPLSWPIEVSQWITLPGIGRSTAGSIVSSAFDLPAPILDGNVKRILTRLIASDRGINQNQKTLWQLSTFLLSTNEPRDFNQALMDLGAMVCTIKNPNCLSCPLKKFCLAYIKYDPNNFPKKYMKKNLPIQEIGIGIVFNKKGELLIAQRMESSSMGGMWEFPGGKKESDETIENTIEREIKEEIGIKVNVGEKLLSFIHSYSHKKLHFTVHLCEYLSGDPTPIASQKLFWVTPGQLFAFPFPAANTKIISALYSYLGIPNKKTIN